MATSPRYTYQQGDHVCTLYASKDEQMVAAVDYIKQGLARGERCLYVCCTHTPDEFRDGLRAAGIAVEREEKRGALILITKREGHLRTGSFDVKAMMDMLDGAVKDALAAGFAGLCAAGDMSWLLDKAPGSEKIAEYEALLNDFYRKTRALGLCLYDIKRLPSETIDHCLATHAVVRVDGGLLLTNPFYELPEIAAVRTASPTGVVQKIEHFRGGRAKTAARSGG